MLSGTLKQHLLSVQEQAETRLDMLVEQTADRKSVNEQLKASDQLRWVRLMNNIRNAAEEIVIKEIVYC